MTFCQLDGIESQGSPLRAGQASLEMDVHGETEVTAGSERW